MAGGAIARGGPFFEEGSSGVFPLAWSQLCTRSGSSGTGTCSLARGSLGHTRLYDRSLEVNGRLGCQAYDWLLHHWADDCHTAQAALIDLPPTPMMCSPPRKQRVSCCRSACCAYVAPPWSVPIPSGSAWFGPCCHQRVTGYFPAGDGLATPAGFPSSRVPWPAPGAVPVHGDHSTLEWKAEWEVAAALADREWNWASPVCAPWDPSPRDRPRRRRRLEPPGHAGPKRLRDWGDHPLRHLPRLRTLLDQLPPLR